MPCITNVDDVRLVGLVGSAKKRLLLLAPGVSNGVASAVASAWARLGGPAVSVILDVDPEVCRLGYGTLEAVTILREAAAKLGALVCHQPGVRIGLLISDDTTIIYSPTPLLVEAGSNQPSRPNAIQLGTPPEDVAREVGLGESPDRERVVGLDPVLPAKMEAVAKDLANCPPVKFDLARRVRVFTMRFQFVELEMTGYMLSKKRVRIPTALMGLARDRDMETQFQAHFTLIPSGRLEVERGDSVISEETLTGQKKEICDGLLTMLEGYGWVVLRANKDRLVQAVEALRADVTVFQKGIEDRLQRQIKKNVAALVEGLLPAVQRNPPEKYTKIHGPELPEAVARKLLEADLKKAFHEVGDLVKKMAVTLVFKDVAIESLTDEKFMGLVEKKMPGVKLHDEFEAPPPVKEDTE